MKKISVILKRMRHYYDYLGIKNKILFQVSCLVVFSTMVFSAVFLSVYNKKIINENVSYAGELLKNTSLRLDGYFDEIAAIVNDANYNYYLQNYLIGEKDNEMGYITPSSIKNMQNYEMSSKLFDYSLNNRPDISSIMIFGKKNLLLHKGIYTFMTIVQDYTNYKWYKEAVDNPGKSIITGPEQHVFLKGNKEKTFSLSRRISSYEDGSFLGVILIDMNLNKIAEICDSVYPNNESSVMLLNEKGELICAQNSSLDRDNIIEPDALEVLNKELAKAEGKTFSTLLGEKKYQVVSQIYGDAQWQILSIIPKDVLNESIRSTIWIVIAALVFMWIILVVALNYLLTRVVKPVISLKQHMDLADAVNLGIRVDVDSHNEIGMLGRSFNKMLERIENLMNQVMKEQEEKRKYELQALQAQINPHFLYNTLDSIIWMAETKDSKVIPMIEALAMLFRISLNKGNSMIKIEDEMEHVRNYLFIQSMRYSDKFDYVIQIADDTCYCKTIKLIVQPIVENSIYHGIKKKRGKGSIKVNVFREKDNLYVTVMDNGIGMSPEICETILKKDSHFENTSGSGIGVKNVNQRIQLYFGEKYGLYYKSEIGQGTEAVLKLPIIEETIG